MPDACVLITVLYSTADRLHARVTDGALTPRDTRQRHHVSVRSGQGHRGCRGILQGNCLIPLIFICVLNSVIAHCTDPDDGITLPAAFASNTLVMQMTSGS